MVWFQKDMWYGGLKVLGESHAILVSYGSLVITMISKSVSLRVILFECYCISFWITSQVSLQQDNQGYYSSQFLENGSTSKQPWLGTQLQQPAAMISQSAASFNLADNIFLQNHSVQHNQQIEPAYQSTNRFTSLHENWVKQSNFFWAAKQDLQSVNNLASHLNM